MLEHPASSLVCHVPFAFQLSQENTEYIPTRITKVAAPKPAANPLQFIKVGPASLYKSAQEQLKKVEEIKKVTKEVQDEAEDWQSVSGSDVVISTDTLLSLLAMDLSVFIITIDQKQCYLIFSLRQPVSLGSINKQPTTDLLQVKQVTSRTGGKR